MTVDIIPDTEPAVVSTYNPHVESPRDTDSRAFKLLAFVVLALIPLQILADGFLPQDDALRHAAKAISGRDWSDILLHRPGIVDFSPGWHALLALVHRTTGLDALGLVLVEVTSLFLLFSLGPLLLMRRAEAWVVALATVAVLEPQMVMRLTLGRPLILSMAVVTVICLLWTRLDGERMSRAAFAAIAALIATATWIHGSWYLYALPIVAFFLAGRRRAAGRLFVATAYGVAVGALLTGSPLTFLRQNLELALSIGGGGISGWVFELRPYPGSPMLVLAVTLIVVMRRAWRGEPARTLLSDPVFMLAMLGWALGLRSARFWMDWGTPAVLVFIALELQALWLASEPHRRRLLSGMAVCLLCFLVWTGNVNDRWSNPSRDTAFRALLAPEHAGALPDSGGILYSDDKTAFYDLFFLRPTANWRYSTGYAPELMPAEDYRVYHDRIATSVEALEPWVRKMRPEDRMVIRDPRGIPPWRWLEWHAVGDHLWSGRLPR
jgi:hypothetical protein